MKESRKSCAISPSCRATRTPEQFFHSHRWFPIAATETSETSWCTLLIPANLAVGREHCHALTLVVVPVTTFHRRQPPGPRSSIVIKKAFTCQMFGLVYDISCRRSPAINISETERTLRQRFGDHLRSIEKKPARFSRR